MSDWMAPQGIDFHPVSSDLAKVRVFAQLLWGLPLLVVFVLLAVAVDPLFWIPVGAVFLFLLWIIWITVRQVRAMGFTEGPDEFYVRRGIMFRSMTAIPYGRIQYVDIAEGPIARHYGIASITLHTASVETSASLDGVPVAEAVRLRDLLAQRGNAELAGL